MKYLVALLLVGMVVMTGCKSSDYSDNYQALTARTAADTAITVAAEEGDLTAEQVLAIKETAEKIEKFLDTGVVNELTSSALALELKNRIPIQYQPYFAAALAYLSAQTIDAKAVVPAKVLRLVKNAIVGVKNGTTYWVAVEVTE